MRMAPVVDREAEHIRDKARKDLLALLEGVSKAAAITQPCARLTQSRSVGRRMSFSVGT